MEGYWTSPEAIERKVFDRRVKALVATIDQEPRRKGAAGRAEAAQFRAAVRQAVIRESDWPRPQAAIALDLRFDTSRRQPPGLWTLPKNYLDLLGSTSAPADDPAPLLYEDDSQVKLLFVSCRHGWKPDGTARGSIHVNARTRASALADMQLAAKLVAHDDEFDGDDGDPLDSIGDYDLLPPEMVPHIKFNDAAKFQKWLLGLNDRVIRSVFFREGHWLLTGRDPMVEATNRLRQRVGTSGSAALDTAERMFAETNVSTRSTLRSMIRIELPSLPVEDGSGGAFRQGIQDACRRFLEQYPMLHPLVVPLRVTVLVVPPKRRTADAKDLDNILIEVLKVLEDVLRPHAEPWLLAPAIQVDDQDEAQNAETAAGVARLRSISGSNTWAYQVLELCRQPEDADQGWLVLIPGLGWNQKSIWSEAEDFVLQRLQKFRA